MSDLRTDALAYHANPRPGKLSVELTKPTASGFQLLRGSVVAVSQARQAIWIDLEGPLTLRLARRDLVNFASAPGASWVGREIEVRGWVVDRREQQNGFRRYMISLRHPAQLHLLSSD